MVISGKLSLVYPCYELCQMFFMIWSHPPKPSYSWPGHQHLLLWNIFLYSKYKIQCYSQSEVFWMATSLWDHSWRTVESKILSPFNHNPNCQELISILSVTSYLVNMKSVTIVPMKSLGPVWSLLKSKGINPPGLTYYYTLHCKNNILIQTLSLLLMAKKRKRNKM